MDLLRGVFQVHNVPRAQCICCRINYYFFADGHPIAITRECCAYYGNVAISRSDIAVDPEGHGPDMYMYQCKCGCVRIASRMAPGESCFYCAEELGMPHSVTVKELIYTLADADLVETYNLSQRGRVIKQE